MSPERKKLLQELYDCLIKVENSLRSYKDYIPLADDYTLFRLITTLLQDNITNTKRLVVLLFERFDPKNE